jgi:hypothetical protein
MIEKINGPKLDLVIMAGHMQMHNWDAIEKMRKKSHIFDTVCMILAISLMVYVAIR